MSYNSNYRWPEMIYSYCRKMDRFIVKYIVGRKYLQIGDGQREVIRKNYLSKIIN